MYLRQGWQSCEIGHAFFNFVLIVSRKLQNEEGDKGGILVNSLVGYFFSYHTMPC